MSDIYYPPNGGSDEQEPRPAIALPERLGDAKPAANAGVAPETNAQWVLPTAEIGAAGGSGAGTVPPGIGWPTDPSGTPPAGMAPSGPANHHGRNAVMAGTLAVIVAAAGVGIGLAVWKSSSATTSAAPAATSPSAGQGSGGSGGSGSSGFGSSGSPFGSSGSGSSSGSSSTAAGSPSDISAIASGVDPGLVDINTTLSYQGEQAASTGMVLTSNGEILTNNHVIDGATSISVTDIGNGKTYSASVVGYDRSHDVAVIQLKDASGLQTVNIGDSSKVAVGEAVVGIGNAGGSGGTPSTAGGSVTALNQSITASDEGSGTSEQLTGLIETNAGIEAGDSGGSLVNVSGQVIGMDTAASSGYSFQTTASQAFAIPINTAVSIAKQIEAGSSSSTIHIGTTAFLGVEVSTSGSSDSSGGFGGFGDGFGSSSGSGSTSTVQGATVAGTSSGTPAAKAGLAAGDVITGLGSATITSANDLTAAMATHRPGQTVQLTWVDSSGNQHSANVTLAAGPPA